MGCRNCLKYNGKACELGLSFPCGEHVPHIITPLERAGDLISRSALLEKIQFRIPNDRVLTDIVDSCVKITRRIIEEAPAVDAVPVVHGRWIWNEESECWVCSNCELSALNNYRGNSADSNYRPNCGAKMRGGKDNG